MNTAAARVRRPSEIARETIRQLAQRKLPPTPENYAEIYGELSGGSPSDSAAVMRSLRQLGADLGCTFAPQAMQGLEKAVHARDNLQIRRSIAMLLDAGSVKQPPEWSQLMRELLAQWDARNSRWTQARKRESVEHVLTAFAGDADKLAAKLTALLKAWSERGKDGGVELALVDAPRAVAGDATIIELAAPTRPPPVASRKHVVLAAAGADDEAYLQLRTLSVELLRLAIGSGEHAGHGGDRISALGGELITRMEAAQGASELVRMAPEVRSLLRRVERAQSRQRDTVKGLLGLLDLIVSNIEELVPDGRWVKGQVERLRELIAEPLDGPALAAAEQAFRDVVLHQASIRKKMDEATAALKVMLASFIGRLGSMSDSTGEYQDRIQNYAERIEQVEDIAELPLIIKGLLDDTRAVQAGMQHTREELLAARQRATACELEIERLESELVDVSTLLKSDQLTGVLNRRGLNEALAVEIARSDREGRTLCVALLDVDNFKALNDTHGHDVGDRALQHLAQVVRETVRPSDVVARYGGEEFVVVLPNTVAAEACEVMTRVQRQLTRAFFLQNNTRLLITFSAGVSERAAGESQSAALTRADEALYRAKGSGKNKVVPA